MLVTPVQSPNFNGHYRVLAKNNSHISFLYNDVKKIVCENKIPATFYSDRIDLTTFSKETDNLIQKALKACNINFVSLGK